MNKLYEYIRRRGDKWVVISKKGKVLGTHDSHENALKQLKAIEMHKHMAENIEIDEVRSSDFISWKRKNVTIRGVKEAGQENNAGAMLGKGLYTAFLSNKSLAKEYGTVYFVVNAIPKNPKIFNSLNEWEIWFYNTLVFKYSKEQGKEFPDKRDFNANTTIEDEMQKMGYDGIIIKGREMVNFKPINVLYFKTEDQLENYYNTVINKQPIQEETLLNEKLTNIDDDVNMLYDMYFKKAIDEITQTGNITIKMFPTFNTDTSILKTNECIEAHTLNPCEIIINQKGNFYDPNNAIISISANLQAANYVLQNGGNINDASEFLSPDRAKMLNKEFKEERIKGSIHHELVHWLDDTFHNRHLQKTIRKNLSKYMANEPTLYDKTTVNARNFERQAQIHNIKQLYHKNSDIWDTLSFEDMIEMSPSLLNIYQTLPYSYKIKWIRDIKMRMFREGLLGKKMFN